MTKLWLFFCLMVVHPLISYKEITNYLPQEEIELKCNHQQLNHESIINHELPVNYTKTRQEGSNIIQLQKNISKDVFKEYLNNFNKKSYLILGKQYYNYWKKYGTFKIKNNSVSISKEFLSNFEILNCCNDKIIDCSWKDTTHFHCKLCLQKYKSDYTRFWQQIHLHTLNVHFSAIEVVKFQLSCITEPKDKCSYPMLNLYIAQNIFRIVKNPFLFVYTEY